MIVYRCSIGVNGRHAYCMYDVRLLILEHIVHTAVRVLQQLRERQAATLPVDAHHPAMYFQLPVTNAAGLACKLVRSFTMVYCLK